MTRDLAQPARRRSRLMGRWLRRFPGTAALGAVTLGFFALQWWLGGTTDDAVATRLGAMRPDRVAEQGEWFRLVMPMFLHLGPVHFALNGLAFVQLALLVEYIWGTLRLLVFYLLCGIGAALMTATFTGYALPSLGASGSLMGLAGLLLGARYLGTPALRLFLGEVLGRRLFWGVLFTFVVGLLLEMFFPVVDNWGHLGGFLTGLLLAAATPDADSGEGQTLVAGALLVPVVLGSGLWMTVRGDDALATLDHDMAWALRAKASDYPGQVVGAGLLLQMLDRFEASGDPASGREAFRRELEHFDEPFLLANLAGALFTDPARGLETEWVLERWVAIEPSEPDPLNALAWHLVTRPDAERRDPARAEELVRRALQRIADPASKGGRRSRAAYLDTLGEALLQQGKLEEALEAQQESFSLATELELGDLPEISARLERIREASG